MKKSKIKKNKDGMSLNEICKKLDIYNKKNKASLTYGQYVEMLRTGAIKH